VSDMIALTRDHAADAVAVVRLLRTNQPDLAMFIISAYENDNDGLQALAGSMAALCSSFLTTIDAIASEVNSKTDLTVSGADAVLSRAAAAVVTFDPGAGPEQEDSTA
jgi:hypothetical protein